MTEREPVHQVVATFKRGRMTLFLDGAEVVSARPRWYQRLANWITRRGWTLSAYACVLQPSGDHLGLTAHRAEDGSVSLLVDTVTLHRGAK